MLRRFFFLLLFIVSLPAPAQLPDSLSHILSGTQNDAALAGANLRIAAWYYNTNVDSCLHYARRSLEHAQRSGNEAALGKACAKIGDALFYKGDHEGSTKQQHEAIAHFKKAGLVSEEAAAHQSIGYTLREQGKYDEAIQSYVLSLRLREQVRDTQGIAQVKLNIGVIYNDQNRFAEAMKFEKEALALLRKKGQPGQVANALTRVGNIFWGMKNADSAMAYYNEGLKLFTQAGNNRGIAIVYNNIGGLYSEQQKYSEANSWLEKGLVLRRQIGDKNGQAILLENIANNYLALGQYDKAMAAAQEGYAIASQIHFSEEIRMNYFTMARINSKQGKFKEAYFMLEHYKELSDSLFSVEIAAKAEEVRARYDDEKKMRDIELLNKEKALQAAEIERGKSELSAATTQRIALGAGFILMMGLAFLAWWGYRQKKNANAIILRQKTIVEEKNLAITDSISYARRLQEAMLPAEGSIREGFPDSFVFYRPKDIVAGDFYWYEQLGEWSLIAAADCTGHGVPGAMVSLVCANALDRAVREFGLTEPGLILDKVRELVASSFSRSENAMSDGMDISLCAIRKSTGDLLWSGANNPLWLMRSGACTVIRADKQPIGRDEKGRPFTTHRLLLQKGDMLYLFTDGYADQFGGPKGKKFKYKQLQNLLLQVFDKPVLRQKAELDSALAVWKGTLEQVDDITVVGVRF